MEPGQFLVILQLAIVVVIAVPASKYEARVGEKRVFVFTEKSNWKNAVGTCKKWNMRLLRIDSQMELEDTQRLVKEFGFDRMWGLSIETDLNSDIKTYWVSSLNDGTCFKFLVLRQQNIKLQKIDCNHKRRFICEEGGSNLAEVFHKHLNT